MARGHAQDVFEPGGAPTEVEVALGKSARLFPEPAAAMDGPMARTITLVDSKPPMIIPPIRTLSP